MICQRVSNLRGELFAGFPVFKRTSQVIAVLDYSVIRDLRYSLRRYERTCAPVLHVACSFHVAHRVGKARVRGKALQGLIESARHAGMSSGALTRFLELACATAQALVLCRVGNISGVGLCRNAFKLLLWAILNIPPHSSCSGRILNIASLHGVLAVTPCEL